ADTLDGDCIAGETTRLTFREGWWKVGSRGRAGAGNTSSTGVATLPVMIVAASANSCLAESRFPTISCLSSLSPGIPVRAAGPEVASPDLLLTFLGGGGLAISLVPVVGDDLGCACAAPIAGACTGRDRRRLRGVERACDATAVAHWGSTEFSE